MMADIPILGMLDHGTQSKLRSTQIITSLAQVVTELVQNALDAGARHIDVGVDCEEWACWVRDDGSGMSKDDLAQLCQKNGTGRYVTSKAYDLNSLDDVSTFGFRGEAIASIADLCCIEISSRTKHSKASWSVIMRGGENLYHGQSVRWIRESHGTSVSVRDAFYNIPIRRLSHPNASRTRDAIRRELESFALVFPFVSFTLQDLAKERKAGSSKGHIFSIPKTSSTVAAFRNIFGRALVEHVDTISVQSNGITLEGFISLMGAQSKTYQFLYVNNHLLEPCELHRLVEQKFLSSSFAKDAYDELTSSKYPYPTPRRSPRKAEKRPVYALNVHILTAEIDNCLEPAKTTIMFQNRGSVQTLIMTAVESFLVRHGFVHERKAQKSSVEDFQSHSPSKKRKVFTETNIDLSSKQLEPTTRGKDEDFDNILVLNEIFISEKFSEQNENKLVWTDVGTGQKYLVDARTGNSYRSGLEYNGEETENEFLRRTRRRCIVDTGFLKSSSKLSQKNVVTPQWIKDALSSNRAFRLNEPDIRCGSIHLQTTTDEENGPNQSLFKMSQQSRQQKYHGIRSEETLHTDSYSLTKDNLARARVLRQVDSKFVACLVENNKDVGVKNALSRKDEAILVLVDQHAADERVRVEVLLKDLCRGFLSSGNNIAKRILEPPKAILLTYFERSLLANNKEYLKAFSRWGFGIDDCGISNTAYNDMISDYIQVYVSAIPEVVADKLLIGDELRDLIKGYLSYLQTEGFQKIDFQSRDHGLEWPSALRWCPKELLDLINSKACRGAIMFNDPLSPEQCQSLIRSLSETIFPFICAHGRPSVIPLINRTLNKGEDKEINWKSLVKPNS